MRAIAKARGFLKEVKRSWHLTKAGMLLFGKNPSIYFPNARIRVLKFEGTEFQLGKDMNIVKDKSFDSCLYKSINEAADFIRSQLREFTHLNQNGIFETVPEYPEFAWYEGMINAVIHRDYSNRGEHITVKIFDDRMEIQSPGKLAGFVTLDTMTTKRCSRNPLISRVLTEMGIVRELNEGVKRIYREMKEFFLHDPIYSEPHGQSVLLVLENNVLARSKRKSETMRQNTIIQDKWEELSYLEKQVLIEIHDRGSITSEEVAKIINRGKTTSVKLLNKLLDMKLIVWTGTSKKDNKGNYIMRK